MPSKYRIETSVVPHRLVPVSFSGVVAWEEGCLKCARCAKRQCVYKVYETRQLNPQEMRDSLDFACKNCFRCVQSCPKGLIQKAQDPRFRSLGDSYFTPEIITSLWYQAETGRIPVSGAGYGGPFSGPGFDSMWTDMSEIVRPTRDGIHGREYISTAVDLGRKPMALVFGSDGQLSSPTPPLMEIPIPVIFDKVPWSPASNGVSEAILMAAHELGTLAITWNDQLHAGELLEKSAVVHLAMEREGLPFWAQEGIHMVEIDDSRDAISLQERLKDVNPDLVVMIRLSARKGIERRVSELVRSGAEVIHLKADPWGKEMGEEPRFVLQVARQTHFHLVEAGIRDLVTLVVGGGVAMAEHMCKLIICGADAVSVDAVLLIAMECRVCSRCSQGLSCPAGLHEVEAEWGAARIRNLMGAWHNQLLEVMGAMGMRDVRRLRGEMGRAMFFEDLEREFFSRLGARV
jgi:ferredoxin